MCLLHDIGKMGVSNSIINKPGKLTAEEYDEIKKHPLTGYEILSEIQSRPDLATGARWHHERYDGKGYPDGLKGTDIGSFINTVKWWIGNGLTQSPGEIIDSYLKCLIRQHKNG